MQRILQPLHASSRFRPDHQHGPCPPFRQHRNKFTRRIHLPILLLRIFPISLRNHRRNQSTETQNQYQANHRNACTCLQFGRNDAKFITFYNRNRVCMTK